MRPRRAERRRRTLDPLPATRALGPAERVRLAGEIVAAYVDSRRALRSVPIESAISRLREREARSARLRGDSAQGARYEDTLGEAQRLGRAVARTLALLPGDTRCLARSLVLTRLLARRGIPAKLVIGARAAPEFLAHAWVEHGGEPVLSPGDGSFGRLVEL